MSGAGFDFLCLVCFVFVDVRLQRVLSRVHPEEAWGDGAARHLHSIVEQGLPIGCHLPYQQGKPPHGGGNPLEKTRNLQPCRCLVLSGNTVKGSHNRSRSTRLWTCRTDLSLVQDEHPFRDDEVRSLEFATGSKHLFRCLRVSMALLAFVFGKAWSKRSFPDSIDFLRAGF